MADIGITAPTGSSRWLIGSDQWIKWTHEGSIGNVKIAYSKDGGSDGYPYSITDSTSGTADEFLWTNIPNVFSPTCDGHDIRIEIALIGYEASVNDTSDESFTIRGSLNLTKPVEGDQILVRTSEADQKEIKWTRTGSIQNVQLLYAANGTDFDKQIVGSTSGGTGNEGSYFWYVDPVYFPPSPNAKIKIVDKNDGLVTDISDAFKLQGKFDIIHPENGDVLKVDENYTIEWTSLGLVCNVK